MSKTDILEDRGVMILRVRGKGSKERMIPLTKEIHNATETYLQKSVTLNPSSIYRIVNRYAKKIGIEKRVGAHSCRATLISHLLENQVSPRDVADLVGHSNINTTISIYDKKRLGVQNSAAYKVKFV
jgi:integrase/recombinase XerD